MDTRERQAARGELSAQARALRGGSIAAVGLRRHRVGGIEALLDERLRSLVDQDRLQLRSGEGVDLTAFRRDEKENLRPWEREWGEEKNEKKSGGRQGVIGNKVWTEEGEGMGDISGDLFAL